MPVFGGWEGFVELMYIHHPAGLWLPLGEVPVASFLSWFRLHLQTL